MFIYFPKSQSPPCTVLPGQSALVCLHGSPAGFCMLFAPTKTHFVQFFRVACLAFTLVAQASPFELPHILSQARNLLSMQFEELPFPKGSIQHEEGTAASAKVDGVEYEIECAAHIEVYMSPPLPGADP